MNFIEKNCYYKMFTDVNSTCKSKIKLEEQIIKLNII